ncbi:unnamed protein product [Phytophthora fragariaefolia]|uniref:Unnamed protein product n=1 Tax=Phytophthora fragariaefolia TaxID=1490495 RepID=A0A9W6UA52_9STRA|nr:unnamed protein product [Phytophthora fragariaefolia]
MRSMSFQDLFVKSAEPVRLPPATSLLSPSSAFDNYNGAAAPDATPKGSIDFILDDASHAAVKLELGMVPGAGQASQELRLATPTAASSKRGLQDAEAAAPKRKKRKARICKETGCDKYVVDHGLCIRHGVSATRLLWLQRATLVLTDVASAQGGKRCNIEGCNCRAQNRGLCWKHGASTGWSARGGGCILTRSLVLQVDTPSARWRAAPSAPSPGASAGRTAAAPAARPTGAPRSLSR